MVVRCGGLTPTVIVLVALAAGGFAAAWALHPATGYPQPYPSVVELIFAPSRPRRSPISVSVQLVRDYPATVTLNIHLAGADLAHRGWSLTAHVPSGVHVIGAQGNNPRTGQISQFGGDAETVYADPGAQPEREFDMVLGWSDLHSGPLQMRGPDLHAILPDVSVRNEVRRAQPRRCRGRDTRSAGISRRRAILSLRPARRPTASTRTAGTGGQFPEAV